MSCKKMELEFEDGLTKIYLEDIVIFVYPDKIKIFDDAYLAAVTLSRSDWDSNFIQFQNQQ